MLTGPSEKLSDFLMNAIEHGEEGGGRMHAINFLKTTAQQAWEIPLIDNMLMTLMSEGMHGVVVDIISLGGPNFLEIQDIAPILFELCSEVGHTESYPQMLLHLGDELDSVVPIDRILGSNPGVKEVLRALPEEVLMQRRVASAIALLLRAIPNEEDEILAITGYSEEAINEVLDIPIDEGPDEPFFEDDFNEDSGQFSPE